MERGAQQPGFTSCYFLIGWEKLRVLPSGPHLYSEHTCHLLPSLQTIRSFENTVPAFTNLALSLSSGREALTVLAQLLEEFLGSSRTPAQCLMFREEWIMVFYTDVPLHPEV